MKSYLVPALAGTVLVSMAGAAHAQSQFPDIDPNHWAYRSVQDLAKDGLVLGYPDGTFLGNRTLTRYEMATLIKRVVDNINSRLAPLEQKSGITPPAPAPVSPAPAASVTAEQIAQVRRLTEEFKTELAVIGTDLATLRTRLAAVEGSVAAVDKRVTSAEDVNKAQQKALDVLARKNISGYIQARYARRGTNSESLAPQGAGQDVIRGYSNGNRDTFNVRYARVSIKGDVTPRAAYKLQLETGSATGADTVRILDAFVTIKDILKHSPLQGFATADFLAGKQAPPFGQNLVFASSERLAPERYIAFSDNAAGLFPSLCYDTGASLKGVLAKRYTYHLGVFNGNGGSSTDLGRRKDFVAHVGIPLTPKWSFGISGYDGEGNTPLANPTTGTAGFQERERRKSLIGLDSQIKFGAAQLNVEYVHGKGGLVGTAQTPVPAALRPAVDAATVDGGYAELGYKMSSRFILATAYEYFNRNADPKGSFSGLTGANAALNGTSLSDADFKEERFHFGAHYFIDAATRLRLWYEAPLNYPNLPGAKEALSRSGQYTAEVQVKF